MAQIAPIRLLGALQSNPRSLIDQTTGEQIKAQRSSAGPFLWAPSSKKGRELWGSTNRGALSLIPQGSASAPGFGATRFRRTGRSRERSARSTGATSHRALSLRPASSTRQRSRPGSSPSRGACGCERLCVARLGSGRASRPSRRSRAGCGHRSRRSPSSTPALRRCVRRYARAPSRR